MRQINVLELRCVTGSGGGPEKTILLSAQKTDASGFNIIVAYIHNVGDAAYTVAERARELGIHFCDLPERSLFDPWMLTRLARIILRERIDIVHAHDYKSNLIGVLLYPFFGFKLVSTAHGWVTPSRKLETYYLLDKLALRCYEKVMIVSSDLRDPMLQWGLSPNQIVYLPNGIDTDQFFRRSEGGALRKELQLPPERPLVAAIGRLSPEKDLITFLQVARRVAREMPDVHFLIVGEGPDRPVLQQSAEQLELNGRLSFLGQRSDMINIYNSLDLLLLTSRREGLPNVVLEAMAMEVPVIATNVGGMGEIIEDEFNGRLCRAGDIDGVTDAALELLRDRVSAIRLARAARETVCRKFSFSERVRKLESIYVEVMGSKVDAQHTPSAADS